MAQPEKALKVQCFVKKEFQPMLQDPNGPRLLYVSRIRPDASAHPRVMHAHEDFVEIILICSGISEYLIHEKKQYIRAGDLIVYNSGVVHDEVSGPDIEVGSYCIAIAGLDLPGLRRNALIPEDMHPVFRTNEHFSDIETLCEMMFQNLSSGRPGAEAFSHYLMIALLEKVNTIVHGDQPPAEPDEEPHIMGRRIKQFIDSHYMEPLTLQSMGEALHISPYYLSHIFKQMTGYSPVQYLLRRRIGEAQTLLITTDLPITRIAEMVGYDTQSYFNLQFTKNVGMPPQKYRKAYIVSADEPSAGKKKKRAKKEGS